MAIDARVSESKLAVAGDVPIAPRIALAILGHIMAHGLALPAGPFTPGAENGLVPATRPGSPISIPRAPTGIRPEAGDSAWPRLRDARFTVPLAGSAPVKAGARAEPVRYAVEGAAHPAQQELLVLTREQPGLNIHEMSFRLRLSRSATRYHLRGLIRSGRVVTHRQGHHLLHFSAKMTVSERAAVALLRINSVRMVVEAVFQDPLVHPARLAARLGFSARSVRRSVRMLERAGLARPDRDPRLQGGYRLTLHPDTRLAWVLWCKGSQPEPQETPPMSAAGAWFIPVEILVGLLASL